MAENGRNIVNKKYKSLVICTGASRGIGRAIALAIVKGFSESIRSTVDAGESSSSAAMMMASSPLRMVLIARSVESLRETACLVRERCGSDDVVSDFVMDLSDLDTLPAKLQEMMEPLSGERYDSCWLINNAGSVGPLGLACSISGEPSMKEWRRAIDLNVTSAMWISSQFTKTFLKTSPSEESSAPATTTSPLIRIVNISSLCAVEPFPTMAIYCAGKAGRDMFHRALAKEHPSNSRQNGKEADDKKDRNIQEPNQVFKVLNYAPGPCDTQMTDGLVDCPVLDDELHKYFAASKQNNKLVQVEDTAEKLVQILRTDAYESGSHVDYFDV